MAIDNEGGRELYSWEVARLRRARLRRRPWYRSIVLPWVLVLAGVLGWVWARERKDIAALDRRDQIAAEFRRYDLGDEGQVSVCKTRQEHIRENPALATKTQVTDGTAHITGTIGVYNQDDYPLLISAPTKSISVSAGSLGLKIEDISTSGWLAHRRIHRRRQERS